MSITIPKANAIPCMVVRGDNYQELVDYSSAFMIAEMFHVDISSQ